MTADNLAVSGIGQESKSLRDRIVFIRDNLDLLRAFLPEQRYATLAQDLQGADAAKVSAEYAGLIDTIHAMPMNYEKVEPKEELMTFLHYRWGEVSWYLTHRDPEPEQLLTVGVRVTDREAIIGNVVVSQLIKAEHGVVLELDYAPRYLKVLLEQIKAKQSLIKTV